MSTSYSQETRTILNDFLDTLRQVEELDPVFLRHIETMVENGSLATRERIEAVISDLRDRHNESPD